MKVLVPDPKPTLAQITSIMHHIYYIIHYMWDKVWGTENSGIEANQMLC